MKVLIVGLGSIAQKHLFALRELIPDLEVIALRSGKGKDVAGVINIYDWQNAPKNLDFAMICNPTSAHLNTIDRLIDYQIPLFIEKPPFNSLEGVYSTLEKIKSRGIRTYTAFNFRFHPLLLWLKDNLKNEKVLEVQAYCGSYLPEWRPGRDYRTVYSAKKSMGGGVHLDLIHELDYLLWLFGKPNNVCSERGIVSDLEINSGDFAKYWLSYDSLHVSLLLNYYRRDPKRQLELVMKHDSWVVDLLSGTITNSQEEVLFEDKTPVSNTYKAQLQYFLMQLKSGNDFINNLEESTETLKYALS